MLVKLQRGSVQLKALVLSLVSFLLVSMASAQTAGGWDLDGAESTTTALLAVGVTVTVAMVVYRVGKRAANKV